MKIEELKAEEMARARLNEAAPKLLEALEWSMTVIGDVVHRRGQNDAFYDRWIRAKDAIAQATGEDK